MHIIVLAVVSIVVAFFIHWIAGVALFIIGWKIFKYLD